MSFYDWYCDLPPASPQTWGEQTDVPESADWYNSTFLLLWGSNVPQTRTPDAHFYTEVRYKGTKSVVICPDYSEAAKFADLWLHPKQGTDAALAMAMGHVILKEFHLAGRSAYFDEYCRKTTDMPMLVTLEKAGDGFAPGRLLRAADLEGDMQQTNNPDWKTLAFDEGDRTLRIPNGSIGFRWGESGKWNIEDKDARDGSQTRLALTLADQPDAMLSVAFPYFGGTAPASFHATDHEAVLYRNVPTRIVQTKAGPVHVATVFDLMVANYGIDRGFGGGNVAASLDDDVPYTPAWAEAVTGVDRDHIITVARQFADNADKTHGKSMVILGAGLNHWYHMDMIYRGIINMLVMCGCVGQSGGGWSHYVGQEKLRPQTGWTALAFALDWNRPPRQMNSTSFFYAHTSQWRYEKLETSAAAVAAGGADGCPIEAAADADRLQREGRADGLAAVRAATGNQLADASRPRRSGRAGGARLCGGATTVRRPEILRRGPGRCRPISPATCSSGAATCWEPAARGMNIS